MRAAIARELDQAVAGAGPDLFRILRRKRQRADGRTAAAPAATADRRGAVSPPHRAVRSGLTVSQCMPLSCVASRYCVAR